MFFISIPYLTSCQVLAESLAETGILAPAPQSENPVVTEIRRALLSDQFASARSDIQILLQKDNISGEAEYWAGLLCLRTGQPEDAIRHLRVSQQLGNSAYTDEALALAYYAVNQFKLFVASMEAASQKLPNNDAPYYYLGRYYLSVDVADFQQAEGFLTKTVSLSPHDTRALYYLAFCQQSEGSMEPAKSNYLQVLRTAQSSTNYSALAELGLAQIAFSSNHHAEALDYAESAVKGLPYDKDTHTFLAQLLAENGDTSGALRQWQTVQSLDPTSARAAYGLFRLYMKTRDKPRADQALDQFKALAKLYGTD